MHAHRRCSGCGLEKLARELEEVTGRSVQLEIRNNGNREADHTSKGVRTMLDTAITLIQRARASGLGTEAHRRKQGAATFFALASDLRLRAAI